MVDFSAVRQTDGFTCGPTVAMVASAALDPVYAGEIADPAAEQHRIHAAANRLWPRRLGTTPWGVAAVISRHSAALDTRYRWKVLRKDLHDVLAAVECGWPVALLIGKGVPRHWVLILGHADGVLRCFNPSRGEIREVTVDDVRAGRLEPLGFPRAYAVVLPAR